MNIRNLTLSIFLVVALLFGAMSQVSASSFINSRSAWNNGKPKDGVNARFYLNWWLTYNADAPQTAHPLLLVSDFNLLPDNYIDNITLIEQFESYYHLKYFICGMVTEETRVYASVTSPSGAPTTCNEVASFNSLAGFNQRYQQDTPFIEEYFAIDNREIVDKWLFNLTNTSVTGMYIRYSDLLVQFKSERHVAHFVCQMLENARGEANRVKVRAYQDELSYRCSDLLADQELAAQNLSQFNVDASPNNTISVNTYADPIPCDENYIYTYTDNYGNEFSYSACDRRSSYEASTIANGPSLIRGASKGLNREVQRRLEKSGLTLEVTPKK